MGIKREKTLKIKRDKILRENLLKNDIYQQYYSINLFTTIYHNLISPSSLLILLPIILCKLA
jgi:hypothetical protein